MNSAPVIRVTRPSMLPAPDRGEVLRYAGVREGDMATLDLLEDCIREAEGVISPAVCYAEYPARTDGDMCELGFARVESHSLARNIAECDRMILFAATLGIGADRLIMRYSRTAPARAVMLDALLAERIEAVCDAFEREAAEGRSARPRFSAGYGDLPLEFQREIFRALSPERHIGLTLNASLLMSPSKSVTAILAFPKEEKGDRVSGG